MADPLRIGTGIAGLVTLADLVFIRIFKYVQAVKGANKDITALSSEVGALYGILTRLRLISDQLESDGFNPATSIQHIHSCRQTLEKLSNILERESISSAQVHRLEAIKRKLHWPFTASEVKILLAEIERHKATLGLALNADGMSGLVQSLSVQATIRDTVQDIEFNLRQKHEADTRIAINTKRQSVLQSFGKTDPSKNQKMGLKSRQPGTGMWLFDSEEFQSWSQMENSKLWLYGIPGAGKTILAATIIEEVLRTSSISHAVAFYYCDYKDLESQKPSRVLGSLVQQLAKQDEQCFEKVQSFCDERNSEYKDDFEYDSQELQVLFLNMAANFERVTLVVDGLDECGSNVTAVTEILVGLHCEDNKTNIKIVFLSRDEIEIRECLEAYTQLAIAARSSDLKLYVGAEIESRVRKKKLRIKDPSLKEYIMKQLVDGAHGMFRWVVCQMDYLCELPNDSSRRKALSALPPTLNATYERILRSVNSRNMDVQKLVSRALRWLIYRLINYEAKFSTAALCEAVSVNIGDSRRDLDAISDETDILRWCSSLVRKSADGNTIELAHFTVKEFLLQLPDEETGEFAAYRVGPGPYDIELAKVCLIYLNFQDFNQVDQFSPDATQTRFEEYPLRRYAVRLWFIHAWGYLDDPEVFTLVKQLLSPSKPNNLILWAQDFLATCEEIIPVVLATSNAVFAELTALHFAAMLGLPEVCTWLIDRGCDVNRSSVLGTPLHCGLFGFRILDMFDDQSRYYFLNHPSPRGQSLINILLEGGADPNRLFATATRKMSPLEMSVSSVDLVSTVRLLEKGGRLDERCLELLEDVFCRYNQNRWDAESISIIAKHISCDDLEAHPKLIGELGPLNFLRRPDIKDEGKLLVKASLESSLRDAAQSGQEGIVKQLLEKHELDIQAEDEDTGLTALHYAAMNDQIEVVKILLGHGAHIHQTDQEGKSAVHHASGSSSSRCLRYFLENYTGSSSTKIKSAAERCTAAYIKDEQLDDLAPLGTPITDLKTKDGMSPLLCAASNGSWANIDLLLHAGCTISDRASDGSTALHHAAKSHSVAAIRLLLDKGSDIRAVTKDWSTVLHYALLEFTNGLGATVDLLLEKGVDACKTRKDGKLPIHLLIGDGTGRHWDGCNRTESEEVMERLVPLTIKTNIESLHVFNEICLLKPQDKSDWLLTIFEIFLAHGADLATADTTGKSALQSLATVWQESCSLPYGESDQFSTTSTEMMHLGMDSVPLEGPLHDICINPGLAKVALMIDDEDLVLKFLEHSPDVDIKNGESSIIETACMSGCSSRLLQDLFARSTISADDQQRSGLVRLCCGANPRRSLEVAQFLMDAGYSPNDVDPITGVTPLMSAARHGNTEVMQLLTSKGANLNTVDKAGWNVAHHACGGGHLNSLRVLRNAEVEWNRTGTWSNHNEQLVGVTPLHLAAAQSDSDLLEYILDEGLVIDINAVTECSSTALYISAWEGFPLNVCALLTRNADSMIRAFGDETPLHLATRVGDETMVMQFLQHGCNANVMDRSGLDCEMLARKHGHQGLAKKIRDHKEQQAYTEDQQLVTPSPDGHTNERRRNSEALRVAIDLADIDLCKRTIEDGADLSLGFDSCQGCKPLLYALHTIDSHRISGVPLEIAETLVLQGASIEGSSCSSCVTEGYTVFHYAARFGYLQLLRILLEKYPMEIFELESPIHPIHLAVLEGQYECVELMVGHFVENDTCKQLSRKISRKFTSVKTLLELQVADRDSQHTWYLSLDSPFPTELWAATPLQIAANCGHVGIASYLLDRGAAMDTVDGVYRTALHHAAMAGQIETVELLLDSGANMHALDISLRTACHLAIREGQSEVLGLLMQRGADLRVQDWKGRRAFHHAATYSSVATMSAVMTAANEYDLGLEDFDGFSPISTILEKGNSREISYLFGLAPGPTAYKPHTGNILTAVLLNRLVSVSLFKKLLKRVPSSLVKTLLNHRAKFGGTPLYTACTVASPHWQEDAISTLLQVGADLEHQGGDHGTPLVGACTAGRLSVVKLLVSKGAKISYERNGNTVSALNAAKHFPEIVRWILVEQYTKGPRRLLGSDPS